VRHTWVVPSNIDPLRTLGLGPGATPDEIRRAYRRLAKANHPDSAGEAALPQFLAIHAAYESLLGPQGGWRPALRGSTAARPAARPAPAGDAWRADPERARATRETYRRRADARAGKGSEPGPDPASGTAGAPPGASRGAPPGATPRPGSGSGPRAGARSRPGPGSGEPGRPGGPTAGTSRRPGGGRKRPSNKATLGSTTYDAAEDEPFEPEWSGGTWYGASSGTYWTINPKEYADPRKHGPEYQRRARRPAGEWDPAPGEPPAPDEPFTDSSASGAEAAAGAGDAERFDVPPSERPWTAADGASAAPTASIGGRGYLGNLALRTGFAGRFALALVAWPPIGLVISAISGEVTGCGRFAASCVDLFGIGTWLIQLTVIAVLLALPWLAAISAFGTLTALAASVPTAVFLSATGGSRQPAASAAVLGGVLAIAYLGGVVFAVLRRLRSADRGPVP
jgi:hypothetical protein